MKRIMFSGAIALAALVFSSPAAAEYVSADVLNCRAGPAASETIVTKLVRGDSVSVRETSGTWSLLGSQSCWVLTRYLSDNYVTRSARSATPLGLVGTPRARSSKKLSRPLRSSSSQSGCPCSGSKICIGPRGGRYCITSGGNKRYGV